MMEQVITAARARLPPTLRPNTVFAGRQLPPSRDFVLCCPSRCSPLDSIYSAHPCFRPFSWLTFHPCSHIYWLILILSHRFSLLSCPRVSSSPLSSSFPSSSSHFFFSLSCLFIVLSLCASHFHFFFLPSCSSLLSSCPCFRVFSLFFSLFLFNHVFVALFLRRLCFYPLLFLLLPLPQRRPRSPRCRQQSRGMENKHATRTPSAFGHVAPDFCIITAFS